jgi:hypothetical protein
MSQKDSHPVFNVYLSFFLQHVFQIRKKYPFSQYKLRKQKLSICLNREPKEGPNMGTLATVHWFTELFILINESFVIVYCNQQIHNQHHNTISQHKQTAVIYILRSVIPVMYIRTTVDQWSKHSSQKHNYIYVYNNLSTTCFGHFLWWSVKKWPKHVVDRLLYI